MKPVKSNKMPNRGLARLLLFSLFFAALTAVSGCEGEYSEDRMQQEIEQKRSDFQEKTEDKRGSDAYLDAARDMVDRYHEFAEHHPDNPESADYVYRAAMIQTEALGDFDGALESLQQLVDTWPEHERAPFALFLIGYTASQYMHDYDRAEEAYEQFLDNYPDHEMAGSIAYEKEHLGRSPFEYDFWDNIE